MSWHVADMAAGPQRVSRQVSAGFMEMLREEEAAVEAGESWARLSARLQTDPRFQVRRIWLQLCVHAELWQLLRQWLAKKNCAPADMSVTSGRLNK